MAGKPSRCREGLTVDGQFSQPAGHGRVALSPATSGDGLVKGPDSAAGLCQLLGGQPPLPPRSDPVRVGSPSSSPSPSHGHLRGLLCVWVGGVHKPCWAQCVNKAACDLSPHFLSCPGTWPTALQQDEPQRPRTQILLGTSSLPKHHVTIAVSGPPAPRC